MSEYWFLPDFRMYLGCELSNPKVFLCFIFSSSSRRLNFQTLPFHHRSSNLSNVSFAWSSRPLCPVTVSDNFRYFLSTFLEIASFWIHVESPKWFQLLKLNYLVQKLFTLCKHGVWFSWWTRANSESNVSTFCRSTWRLLLMANLKRKFFLFIRRSRNIFSLLCLSIGVFSFVATWMRDALSGKTFWGASMVSLIAICYSR